MLLTPPAACRNPNHMSSDDPLDCGDASCLTRCHRAFVSNSCHFSGPIRNHPDGPAKVVGRRAGAYAQFRHVTAGTKQSPGRITPTAVDRNFWSAQPEEPPSHGVSPACSACASPPRKRSCSRSLCRSVSGGAFSASARIWACCSGGWSSSGAVTVHRRPAAPRRRAATSACRGRV